MVCRATAQLAVSLSHGDSAGDDDRAERVRNLDNTPRLPENPPAYVRTASGRDRGRGCRLVERCPGRCRRAIPRIAAGAGGPRPGCPVSGARCSPGRRRGPCCSSRSRSSPSASRRTGPHGSAEDGLRGTAAPGQGKRHRRQQGQRAPARGDHAQHRDPRPGKGVAEALRRRTVEGDPGTRAGQGRNGRFRHPRNRRLPEEVPLPVRLAEGHPGAARHPGRPVRVRGLEGGGFRPGTGRRGRSRRRSRGSGSRRG